MQTQTQGHTYGGNLGTEHTLDDAAHGFVLDTQQTEKTRPCPKCGARAALHAADCRRCGTNFARYRMTIEMAAQARPVYAALTAEERRTGKTALREVNAPPKTTSSLPLVLVSLAVLGALAFALWG
jgi:ribosomal protein L40E